MSLGEIGSALAHHPWRTAAAVGGVLVGVGVARAAFGSDGPEPSAGTNAVDPSVARAKGAPVSDAADGARQVDAGATDPPRNDIRIIASHHLEAMLKTSARHAAEEVFNDPNAYVATPVAFGKADEIPMRDGWESRETLMFDSYRDFARRAAKGIPDTVDAVMYDNEPWPRIPGAERQDQDTYNRKFRDLAHKKGLEFLAAPAPTGYGEYFNASAKYADVLILQAQGAQNNPAEYRQVVRDAAAKARRVNPDVRIVGEISSGEDRLGGGSNGVAKAVGDVVGARSASTDGFLPWIFISEESGRTNGIEMTKRLAKRLRDEQH